MNDEPIVGPIELIARVHIATNEGLTGHAEISLPPGTPIDRQGLLETIGQALSRLGEDTRLLTDHEFFRVIAEERFGQQLGEFAVPVDFTYDHVAVSAEALAAHFDRERKEGGENG